jgi:hypothetical protein
MQKETILNILHNLPSGAVTKNNLRQSVQAAPEYNQHSPRSWQIAVNETWEQARHDFTKLYFECSTKEVIAVFPNLKERDGSLNSYAFSCEHFTAQPDYLKTRCSRVKPDAPEAQELVKYLLTRYAANYHTSKPILL